MPEIKNSGTEPSTTEQLLELLTNLIPLVDSVADKIRFAMFFGITLIAWIGIWLFFLKGFGLGSSLTVMAVLLLPMLILLRFWWSLEDIKALPDVLDDMVDDAQGEIRETVQTLRAGEVQKAGIISSAKNLWSIGSLLGNARELLGSYVSIGTLINPFSLIMGILSLLTIPVLLLISIVLAFFAF